MIKASLVLLILLLVVLLMFYPMLWPREVSPVLSSQPVSRHMELSHSSNSFWRDFKITTYLFRNDERYVVFLFPDEPIDQANLQVYWQPVKGQSDVLIEEMAVLLGTISGRAGGRIDIAYELWADMGELLLYSEADAQVLTSAAFPPPDVEHRRQ